MKWVKYIVIGLGLLHLQSVIGVYLQIRSHNPDFLLLLLITIAIREGKIKGILAGFIIGLFQDMYSATYFIGVSSFAKSLVGFGVGYFSESRRSKKIPGIFVPISVGIGINFAVRVLFFTAGTDEGILTSLLSRGLPSALYTMVFGFAMVMFVNFAKDN